jgi:hypothetical protein
MQINDTLLPQELDQIIARHEIRIQQEHIHVAGLRSNPLQQKVARAQVAASMAGLAKLKEYRRRCG